MCGCCVFVQCVMCVSIYGVIMYICMPDVRVCVCMRVGYAAL